MPWFTRPKGLGEAIFKIQLARAMHSPRASSKPELQTFLHAVPSQVGWPLATGAQATHEVPQELMLVFKTH